MKKSNSGRNITLRPYNYTVVLYKKKMRLVAAWKWVNEEVKIHGAPKTPSHIKEELDQLKEANLLTSRKNGRQVLFSANQKHPVFSELHSMVKKTLGMDQILESIIKRLGNLEMALLVDDYAEGKDSGIIDLVLIGNIDQNNLQDLTKKTERYINRKIRTLSLPADEYVQLAPNLDNRPNFVLWQQQQQGYSLW